VASLILHLAKLSILDGRGEGFIRDSKNKYRCNLRCNWESLICEERNGRFVVYEIYFSVFVRYLDLVHEFCLSWSSAEHITCALPNNTNKLKYNNLKIIRLAVDGRM
jgi:hypothetical protein